MLPQLGVKNQNLHHNYTNVAYAANREFRRQRK